MLWCCNNDCQGTPIADLADEKALISDLAGWRTKSAPKGGRLPDDPDRPPRAARGGRSWPDGVWKDELTTPACGPSETCCVTDMPPQRPGGRRVDERYLAVIREEGDCPGLDVDLVDGVHALVVAVRPGAFEKWNQKHPDNTIQANDRIVEVNGKRGNVGEMVGELRERAVWNVRIQRPFEFECCISRQKTTSLGLDLRYAPGGTSLAICAIGPGPVYDWNAHPANASCRFFLYDRIVELNGVRGLAQHLLAASEGQEALRMTVLSYGNPCG
mmetsp:Transcript_14480/g.36636  ORF Transcript_14480/g.36636 Transcript_14480/m.36636 type:complete len:272 (+) Transcript_14480:90-905(+)